MLIKRIFFVLLIAGIIYIGLLNFLLYQTINSGLSKNDLVESFYSNQGMITLSNFLVFFLLLIFSSIIYFKSSSSLYYFLSLFVFSAYAIFNSLIISKQFYLLKSSTGPLSSEYNLNIMLIAFFILAAIASSAISFITIKNLKERKNKNLKRF